MLSETEKLIYNNYLRALAEANNRPYAHRKNFDNLDDATINILHRLELFFSSYKHIQPYKFFSASFKYRKIKFLRLDDFLKYSAVVAYSKWSLAQYNNFIESDEAIKDFLLGFKFICNYCRENNLSLHEYRTKVNNMGINVPLIHLNEQRISFYHLHALKINKNELNSDYVDLIFNDFNGIFDKTKTQYENSNRIKTISIKLTNNKL